MGREGGAFTTKYLYGCRSVGKDHNGCPSPIANGVYDPLITIISWYYIYGPSCPAKYPTKLGGALIGGVLILIGYLTCFIDH